MMMMMNSTQMRFEMIELIAQKLVEAQTVSGRPLRVAVDGMACAGKTTWANDLACALQQRNKNVLQATIDGFHNTPEKRYARGKWSYQGYYHDSYQLDALIAHVLEPLSLKGSRLVQTAVYDFRVESPIQVPPINCAENTLLLFDGISLLRPELNPHFDFRIFVSVDYDVAMQRALVRDAEFFGSPETIIDKYQRRYAPGQWLYYREVRPWEKAAIVIDNNDALNPHQVNAENLQDLETRLLVQLRPQFVNN
jgi:uridine kinase